MNIASQHGFTLIELLVVIVLLAILSMVSIPSFQSSMISNRMTTEINALVGDLHFAKTEAIKRSRSIDICASDGAADPVCSGGANWGTNGWIVVDSLTGEVVKYGEPIEGSDRLEEINVIGGAAAKITFNRYGFAPGGQRSFQLCGPYDTSTRIKGVVVSSSGRIRLAADFDEDGVVESVKSVSGVFQPENMSCAAQALVDPE